MDDHGAQLRGAYGDEVVQDITSVSNRCEYYEEPVVDQFHSDGTSENNLYETQFQQSCCVDYTTNQSEVSDDLSGKADECMLGACNDVTTENSDAVLKSSNVLPEDDNVEPVPVFDGSGHETRSLGSSDLADSHGQQGTNSSGNGGAKDLRTEAEEDVTTKNSLEENVADTESGALQSVPQSANGDSGGFDRLRSGNTKPTMQRRGSRGRKKRVSSLGSDSPPVTFYPEEVAPIAATILTNPEVFVDPDEQSASNLDIAKPVEKTSKLPSYTPSLKTFDRKVMVGGKQQKLPSKGGTLHF